MNEEEKQGLSEKRKTALLRYMAVLFAVAFLLVAASLIMQMHDSRTTISELNATSSSALSNAEQLQEENRALQEKVRTLQSEKDALDSELAAQEQAAQQVQQEAEKTGDDAAQALRDAQQLLAEAKRAASRTQEVYEALLTAKSCEFKEGNVTYAKAMETLKEYKNYLTGQGLAEYEALLKNE